VRLNHQGNHTELEVERALGVLDLEEPARVNDPCGRAGSDDFLSAGTNQVDVSPLIPLVKRRRILHKQRAEARSEAACDEATAASAWHMVAQSLGSTDVVHSAAGTIPPFLVHPSHSCVTCGGFVGCWTCGTVVASQARAAIRRPCRGRCTARSKGCVRKLAEGKLPRGKCWPNGEVSPLPRQLLL
jgi:hypothetical protein